MRLGQLNRLISAKRRLKRGLMQQLLTGRRRFPEFAKSDAKFETRYGNLPADWQYVKVKKIGREVSKRNADGETRTVLSCSKYDGLVDSLAYFGKQVFSDDTSNYKVVRRNQFAYPSNHVEEGSIGLLQHHDAGIVSPIYTVFRVDEKRVFPPFLYKVFKTELYRHIFAVSTNASVDRRGSLRWAGFKLIEVPLPPLPEQKKIAAVLDAADREIDLLTRQLDARRRQKRGLMQQLLTGRVRVPPGSAPHEETS